jgi:hypothetical protein
MEFLRRNRVAPETSMDEHINTYNEIRKSGKPLDAIRKVIIKSIPDCSCQTLIYGESNIPLIKWAAFRWMDPAIVKAILQHLHKQGKLDTFKEDIQKLCDSPSEEIEMMAEKYGLCEKGKLLRLRRNHFHNSFTNLKKPVYVQSIKRDKRKPLKIRQSRKKQRK